MILREFVKKKYIKVSGLIKPGSSVLDMGCAEAKILYFLPEVSYCGVDINKPLIKKLREKGINVYYADLNKDNLPIKKKFDYILLLDILEHVVYPKGLIEKSKKLLKENGRFIISLPNDYHFLNKIRFLLNRELFSSFAPIGHLHIFPIKSGKKFLKQNNLIILKEINLPPHKPGFIPSFFKQFLSKISPNNFTRDVLYLARVGGKKPPQNSL